MLIVGDPHVTVEELADCQRLLDLVYQEAKKCDFVVFLGDLFHNHALVRIEVIEFWKRNLSRLSGSDVFCLVGNHDRSHDTNVRANSIPESNHWTIVNRPIQLSNGIVLTPWYANNEDFVNDINKFDTKLLICHQTFSGSKYENGFYAHDGINPDLLKAGSIVSGHIHTPQSFGKVTYVGAPRWRIASDANVIRALLVLDTDTLSHSWIPTANTCKALVHINDTEGRPVEVPELYKSTLKTIKVDIHGSASYIATRREFWEKAGARVATFPVVESRPTVSESDGIPKALNTYVSGWKPKYGTPADKLLEMVKERIHV
jgi:DNA repair exonuclease SbcCD nuclease subunit